MRFISIVVFGILASGSCRLEDLNFPDWFLFGAASASYQVEGGWNTSDKGESTWDRLLHTQPAAAAGGANGDVACDSYHLWRRDIEVAEELGLDIYRFSISWPRLLPSGFPNIISEDGKRYYNDLIDGLLEKGIEPVVTLYHFDLPQSLQDLGGWANPLIANWFADYARVAFSLFGDRVKIWLTLNEPFGICDVGYSKQQAPYLNDTTIGKYLCNKYTLIAHAKAWRIYDEEFRYKFKGKVSLATLFIWYEPASLEDMHITDLTIEYWEGRYAHPIYSKEGGWPREIEKFLAKKARQEGYPNPRLPPLTAEEIELIRGTYDFYGLNHYTTRLVRKARPGEIVGSWPFYGSDEMGIQLESDPTWKSAAADWFALHPEGLRKQLHWLNQTYGVNEVLITENGYLDSSQHLEDLERLEYIRDNLEQVQLAIADGLNITGYIAWTIMDNFEWLAGYSVNFGLYAVDFTDPLRMRRPRASARYYASVTRARSLRHVNSGINNVQLTIADGLNITGYIAWSVMDNFEWLVGYRSIIAVSKCDIHNKFPLWFKFGAGSSSYQVEGAWNTGGKTESKWDHLTHTYPNSIRDFSNGDIACESYHLWKRDIEMISDLGLEFYRFSISWPRLLPNGFPNVINEEGKRYYNNLIDGLLENGIEPVVTIFHYEMPQIFQDLGGWTNPLASDWYSDYARIVFSLFGDRVKTWITINEPQIECDWYHGSPLPPSSGLDQSVASYLCNKYILVAHAKAWRIYDHEFRPKYNGKISITNHLLWLIPNSPEDKTLTETAREFLTGRYSHAIYSKMGGWPPIVEDTIKNVSIQLGYTRSRLPPFTEEEIELVKGTYDYYGMNHYTTRLVRPIQPWEKINGRQFLSSVPEINAVFASDPNWTYGYNTFLPIYPEGIRLQMQWLQKQYGNVEILITENGYSTTGSNLHDDGRISFIRDQLEQVLMAINEGINVSMYSYWTLMDNFEWLEGYTGHFGLYEVNFTDPMRERTPRKSAAYYSKVIQSRSFDFQLT